MNILSCIRSFSILSYSLGVSLLGQVIISNGFAPEITDLNATDVSYAKEAKLPYLKQAFISTSPEQKDDSILVGKLDDKQGNVVLQFAEELASGQHGSTDSLLIMYQGKLVFESYFRRGRANYPHYQMSITKPYTALALGRAMQLSYLSMEDLDKSILSFLEEIDVDALVAGADKITLADAMNMKSGIRIDREKAKILMRTPARLRGQAQIQTYLSNSSPIPPAPREFKYQGSDPSITMQVVEALVDGSAEDFIHNELLRKMGIINYAWQSDVSGLPKSAAGSSMRSRDMLKWGMLVMNDGVWNGEQLIPKEFIKRAIMRLHTNAQGTSYGFFFWRHDIESMGQAYDCISARGAGGQFILMLPELKLLIVTTAHNKGMGKTLKVIPERILPVFIQSQLQQN